MEIVQGTKNPENKSVYKEVCFKIKGACTRYTNQLAVAKTHFKKVAAAKGKSRARKDAQPVLPPKDEVAQ